MIQDFSLYWLGWALNVSRQYGVGFTVRNRSLRYYLIDALSGEPMSRRFPACETKLCYKYMCKIVMKFVHFRVNVWEAIAYERLAWR